VERGSLSSSRAAVVLSVLLLLDVGTTTIDLSWTRPTVTLPRPQYLPAADARGPRVMRLAEVSRVRLGLDEDAFVAEQLRLAALMTPMVNALYHASVLEPYGLYTGEVAADMARLSGSDPLTLAEICAVDLILAAPGSRASWLAQAVQRRRLVPLGASPAGAIVVRSASAFPRSFLVHGVSLASHEDIAAKLSIDASRVLLTRARGLRGGDFVTPDSSLVPQLLLSGPSDPPVAVAPVAWRPGAASYQITTDATALLVEIDAFVPGWRAYVDGREQTILQANDFGRAVVVPPGAHAVEWRFFPRLVVASLFATWAGLLLVLAAIVVQRRFRRSTEGEA